MRNKVNVKKNVWLGACLLALGVPFSQAWAYAPAQWRPVAPKHKKVVQAPVQRLQQQQVAVPGYSGYSQFRSVQASVAPSLPQQPQPTIPAPTTVYNQPYAQAMAYPWDPRLMQRQMPMQPPVVPISQPVYQAQHKVAVVPPSVAMRSADNGKWRPVMPKVAAKPQVYAQTASQTWRPATQVQPYHAPAVSPASPNVAAVAPQAVTYQQQPYMAMAYPMAPRQYYYPQHYQHYPTAYLSAWPQNQFAHQQHYASAMPQFPAPVPVPRPQVATQPWWQQGQQWKTYPHAKPWPGQKEKIVADYPASVCADCKT